MGKTEVRCPVCQSSFVIGNGGNAVTELSDGIHYLVPETVRNENVSANSRMNAFKEAGIDISKLQTLMQKDDNIKSIFTNENDPILVEIGKGGFIKNPELFRRWITAQTFALIRDKKGWTSAVRSKYNTRYVYRQTKDELELQIKLMNKGVKSDKRFSFFTLYNFKSIFSDLVYLNHYYSDEEKRKITNSIREAQTLGALSKIINKYSWWFGNTEKFMPRHWLNCYKGAGAYYTLQNIIRTHGMVLPGCKDMTESLDKVEKVYNDIISYEPYARRWDILMSVLTVAITKTKFELKY